MPIDNVSFSGTINNNKKQGYKRKIAIATASLVAGGIGTYVYVKKKPDAAISKGIKNIINYIKKSSVIAGLLGFIGGIFGYKKISEEKDIDNKPDKPTPIIVIQDFNKDNKNNGDDFSISSDIGNTEIASEEQNIAVEEPKKDVPFVLMDDKTPEAVAEEQEADTEEPKKDIPFVLMDDKTPEAVAEEQEAEPAGSEIEIVYVTNKFDAFRNSKTPANALDTRESNKEHTLFDKIFALFRSQNAEETNANIENDHSGDDLNQSSSAYLTPDIPLTIALPDKPETKPSESDFIMDIPEEKPKEEKMPKWYFEPLNLDESEAKPSESDFIMDIPEEPKKEALPKWYFEPLNLDEPEAKPSESDFYFGKPSVCSEEQLENSTQDHTADTYLDETDEESSTDAFDKLIQKSAQPSLPQKTQPDLFIDLSTLPPLHTPTANHIVTSEVGTAILNSTQKYRTQKRLSMKNIAALVKEQLSK